MSKFSIFSLVYVVFGSIFFSAINPVAMIDETSIFTILLFSYTLISGIWSIITSDPKQFLIFSLFYVFFSWWISHDADMGMFGPGRDQTIIIAIVIYAIFVLIWHGVKVFKKKYKN